MISAAALSHCSDVLEDGKLHRVVEERIVLLCLAESLLLSAFEIIRDTLSNVHVIHGWPFGRGSLYYRPWFFRETYTQ